MAPKEALPFDDNKKAASSSLSSSSTLDDDVVYKNNDGRPSVVMGETRILETADGAPYVLCASQDHFVNPTTPPDMTPEQINDTLNLTLGLPPTVLTFRSNTSPWLLSLIAFLDVLLVSWWEPYFCKWWSSHVPVTFKRNLLFAVWRVYLAIHRTILDKATGLHPSTSVECHALTTVMFWAQFFPITPPRMRFALGELHVISRSEVPEPNRVEWIQETAVGIGGNADDDGRGILTVGDVPPSQQDHCTVRGLWIQRRSDSTTLGGGNGSDDDNGVLSNTKKSDQKILFWIYGGAYLAGDCQSNSAVADEFVHDCGLDAAFIPQFRLAPEATIDDVLWDVCLAYAWACRQVDDPSTQIVVPGISSGGALALRLVQLIAERHRGEELVPTFLGPLLDKVPSQPRAVIMFAPYVDYTEPKTGTFLHHAKHDLVVSEAVQEYGLPYLNDFIPKLGDDTDYNAAGRRAHSPVCRSMKGLPPLCFVVSEHEVTYDMTVQCVDAARAEGVSATIGVWKYMFHTFSFLQAFVPEGRLSMDFAKDWIQQQLTH